MAKRTESLASRTPPQVKPLARAFHGPHLQCGQLSQRIVRLLESNDPVGALEEITSDDRKKLIDEVDKLYTGAGAQDAEFLSSFGIFCSATMRLPASDVLSTELAKCDEIAVDSGGLMDIWRGTYQGSFVAIEAFRTYPAQSLEEAKEILWRLVPKWRKLNHQNIVTFLGVDTTLFPLALVYDWEENGNIMDYLESHPEASRPVLLLQVARGLQYLHSHGMPHGDLKGTNVLIDESGNARLTDYGLALVNTNSSLTIASPAVGNPRWLAPEIIIPPSSYTPVESETADVFAFGMLCAEVFTGKPPFETWSDPKVARQIVKGDRPELPQNAEHIGLTPKLRDLIQRCWQKAPTARPTMDEVVKILESLEGNNDPRLMPPPAGTRAQLEPPNPRREKKFWRKWLCGFG